MVNLPVALKTTMYHVQLAVEESDSGRTGLLGPNTHARDRFSVLPLWVQVDVRVLSPNAEGNAWRRPYPLGRTYDQRGHGHLGPVAFISFLVGGGLSRLWAGWQATLIIVQSRHSHGLAAHSVPGQS